MRIRSFSSSFTFVSLAAAVLLAAGCAGADSTAGGGGGGAADSGTTGQDAATGADAGTGGGGADVGNSTSDAGAGSDAGTATGAADAGNAAVDAGGGAIDAGGSGGGKTFNWGPKMCAKEGPALGFNIGNRLGDVPVQDCDTGEKRTLDEVCGAKATWLFVAHSHCPTCKATATYTAELAKQLAQQDVAVVHVVHIDDSQTCPGWRKQYGLENIPNLRVYLDKTGAAWSKIKTKPYTAPHAIMGKDRIITYKNHGLNAAGVANKVKLALTL